METHQNPDRDQSGQTQRKKITLVRCAAGAFGLLLVCCVGTIVWNFAVDLFSNSPPADFRIRSEWRYFPGIILGFYLVIDTFRNPMIFARSALQTDSLPRTTTRQRFISKLFFVLGIASISYGAARWQIVPEILSVLEKHIDRYAKEHASESTNGMKDFFQLRKRLLMAGGMYPGWSQAIFPTALGLALLLTGYYVAQRKGKGTSDPPP